MYTTIFISATSKLFIIDIFDNYPKPKSKGEKITFNAAYQVILRTLSKTSNKFP
jgi:hypothetical protein